MVPTKVTLDPSSLAKLERVPDGTEICDSTGKTLGIFLSPEAYKQMAYAWARLDFDEDLARQAEDDYRAGRVKTTAEVLEQLKSLDTAEGP